MKVTIYLHKNNEDINYGEMWKIINAKERKGLTPLERAKIVVKELNELLPTICITQKTMYYFVREVA